MRGGYHHQATHLQHYVFLFSGQRSNLFWSHRLKRWLTSWDGVIYFLHDQEAQPDFLFPWLFGLLQHDNGYIRHAAVKMISHEIGPLTVHIRFPDDRSIFMERLKPAQADKIICSLFISLHQYIAAWRQPAHKRYKYIDALPPSPYKSANMVLAELEDSCGRKYLDHLVSLMKSRQ